MITRIFSVFFAILFIGTFDVLSGDEEIYWSTDVLFKHVPPLKHDASGRMPMVTWPAFVKDRDDKSFNEKRPLPPEVYKELVKRGFTQRIPMNEEFIPMALAIQAAGAKVVFVEGAGGNGPFELGPDPLHKLADYKIAKGEQHYACPCLLAGWAKKSEKVRETLGKFKAAGITVDAAWLDWEVEPWGGNEETYRQAKQCVRCIGIMPKRALSTYDGYRRYVAALRTDLFSTYAAAPIREFFPACSVTDWCAIYSSPERPTASCWGQSLWPPRGIGFCTAANPVAYGNDIYYEMHWKKEWNWPLDEKHMDRVYTQIMFAEVSDNAENMKKWAPERQCVPWVCRYCPDVNDPKVPILSRKCYREILRHIWLRGADSMQIFNEPRKEYPAIAIEEIQDVVSVYDEMLEYRRFLDDGEVMNTLVPLAPDNGAIWSGLLLGDEALVRAFTHNDKPMKFSLSPFPGASAVELEAPPNGATWILKKDGSGVKVQIEPSSQELPQ